MGEPPEMREGLSCACICHPDNQSAGVQVPVPWAFKDSKRGGEKAWAMCPRGVSVAATHPLAAWAFQWQALSHSPTQACQ